MGDRRRALLGVGRCGREASGVVGENCGREAPGVVRGVASADISNLIRQKCRSELVLNLVLDLVLVFV